MGLIERIASDPYAGAFNYLRSIDPLYQAELDCPRDWEVRLWKDCGCNCPNCHSQDLRTITVEAVTAEEATALGKAECRAGEITGGVRPKGSRAQFWEPEL